MVTVAAVQTPVGNNGLAIVWDNLDQNDDGEFVEVYEWPTITVQPTSPSGFIWEGTNDLAIAPVPIPLSSADYPVERRNVILPRYRYIRPRNLTTTNNIVAALFASRQKLVGIC